MNSIGCSARTIGSCRTRVRSEPSFLTLFGEYNKYVLRRARGVGRHLMAAAAVAALRGAVLPGDLAVGACRHRRQPVRPPPDAGGGAELGRACTTGCASMCSPFASRVEGAIPPGPHLIAVKHQSMFETTEMVRIGAFAGDRDQARARRHPALRLDDPTLWRHPGRALGRAPRRCARWSRRARRRSPAAAR